MFHQASDREAVYACFTFSHWLVYANSAANPIIYNFLSGEWAGKAGDRGQQQCPGQYLPIPNPDQIKNVGGGGGGTEGGPYLLLPGNHDCSGHSHSGGRLNPRSPALSGRPATLPTVAKES